MEGFIKYFKINTVGNSKRGFTEHNAGGKSLIFWSRMVKCSINTVHVLQSTIKLMDI